MALTAPGRSGSTPLALDDGTGLGRPPKRKLWSRVPSSLTVAFVAALLAITGFLVVTADRSGTQVAVAAHDLNVGEVLNATALRYQDVTVPKAVLDTLVTPVSAPTLQGSVATHPIVAGTMVARTDFAPAAGPSQQRSMSVPIDAEHAVGGALHRGDVVDVLDGAAHDGAPNQASYVVTGAQVLAVPDRPSAGGLSGSSKYWVTLALRAPVDAQRLAAAIEQGKVDIVRSTGAPAASETPATSGSSTPGR